MNNPQESNFKRWRVGFEAAKKYLKGLGVDVVNASPDSDLKTFRIQPLDKIMREWGL